METRILSVFQETPDTVRIRLATDMAFVPGQFVMVGAHVNGPEEREIKRSYSVSSVFNGEWIELTVKEQTPGTFSTYAQGLKEGDVLNLYGPFGHHFSFEPATMDAEHVVFIAGGSGIGPFRAMLQAAARDGYEGKLTLLYSVKTMQDIIFGAELKELAEKGNIQLVVTITRPTDDDQRNWTGAFGRISGKLLKDALGDDLATKRYYVCGPTPMVQDVQALLSHNNVPREHIKTEKYGPIDG